MNQQHQLHQLQINMSNDETIQSNKSAGSARKLMQLIKLVELKRNERQSRRQSERLSYIGTVLPSNYSRSPNKRISHYKQKIYVYKFLYGPRGWIAISYHILVFIMVFTCLVLTILSTIKNYHLTSWKYLLFMEKIMLVWFSLEFLLRLWASSCKPEFNGIKGKFKFIFSPFRILDLTVIILSAVVLYFSPQDGHVLFAASAFRGFHRSFQVMEMIRLERSFRPWTVLSSVVYAQREQLIITTYIGFLAITFMAFFLYLVENGDQNFENVGEALWWAVVTLCTIGYGDKVPITWLGKLISSLFIVFGVCILALPSGIIGTGLALKVQEEQRRRQKKKKKEPAAVLIQNAWRYYSLQKYSYATLKKFCSHSNPYYLSEAERNAIEFLIIIKFCIAKEKFKRLSKPIDVKDVLEQFEYDHNEVLMRIKNLQNGLVSILGTVDNNAYHLVESKVSLAARIIRVEELVKEINNKLDVQNEKLDKVIDKCDSEKCD